MSSFTLCNATIVDGTGRSPSTGNVVVHSDRIVSVGGGEREGRLLDADGLVVAP